LIQKKGQKKRNCFLLFFLERENRKFSYKNVFSSLKKWGVKKKWGRQKKMGALRS
jgi:hypothetical protein